ncbi:MAG TPA: hypothetical protein VK904_06375 [Miltoncostaeaceae bacterium]|nr:hypothetical protein [Miltoncostaeaceae bacterium]
MSGERVAAEAARLAAAVAWLGEAKWREDAARLARGRAPSPAGDAPPTFGEVARGGTALVEGLAAEGRWDEAAAQARHLRAFFAREGGHLGPVAAPAFDGLLAAVLARDPGELGDFTALIREIFP